MFLCLGGRLFQATMKRRSLNVVHLLGRREIRRVTPLELRSRLSKFRVPLEKIDHNNEIRLTAVVLLGFTANSDVVGDFLLEKKLAQ